MYHGIFIFIVLTDSSQYPELLAQIRTDQARETQAKQKAS